MACKASGENRDSIEIKKGQASNSGSLSNQVTRPGLASPIQKRFVLPKGLCPASRSWLYYLSALPSKLGEQESSGGAWIGFADPLTLCITQETTLRVAELFCFSVCSAEQARRAARKTKRLSAKPKGVSCYPTWIRTKTSRTRICGTTVILSGNF